MPERNIIRASSKVLKGGLCGSNALVVPSGSSQSCFGTLLVQFPVRHKRDRSRYDVPFIDSEIWSGLAVVDQLLVAETLLGLVPLPLLLGDGPLKAQIPPL
jgi:hypothetical protein